METPVQLAARLLVALNELVEQEGMYLRGGYYHLAVGVRERTEPLVQQLVALAGFPGVSDFRSRVSAVVERSLRHSSFLQEKMHELAAEIRQTDQSRHRAAQLAPAYVRSPNVSGPRFSAAG